MKILFYTSIRCKIGGIYWHQENNNPAKDNNGKWYNIMLLLYYESTEKGGVEGIIIKSMFPTLIGVKP